MAQAGTRKKTAPRKRPVKKKVKSRKKKLTAAQIWRYSIILFFVVLLFGSMTAAAYFVFLREAPSAGRSGARTDAGQPPLYSTAPANVDQGGPAPVIHPVDKKRAAAEPAGDGRPRVAIIIDDMGFRQQAGEQLLALPIPLSFAFLPYGPYTKSLAEKARLKGRDVLLHLPMEPIDSKQDPGPGALYTFMNTKTMAMIFERDLAAVPGAMGVNNHMGSRFTENREAMASVLEMVRQHKLFFLDSVTSKDSVGASLAVALGVKTARRHVFLDHEQDRQKIKAQLQRLLRLARENGQAVAIGHPHPETLAVLKEELATLSGSVEVVGISRLLY